mmetsp:Transcript_15130/g.19621  ORF Transcript_15130/g.19621 Transcript_15130/m.19621 type:complete len:128 (-) Transcript_15130:207-590(-)
MATSSVAKSIGQIGWNISVLVFSIFMIWALLPNEYVQLLLLNLSVTFPNKYWAFAIPSWLIVTFFSSGLMYMCLNLMVTPSLESLDTITDSYAQLKKDIPESFSDKNRQVPNIVDMDIREVTRQLYS